MGDDDLQDLKYLHKKVDYAQLTNEEPDGSCQLFRDLERCITASQVHSTDKNTSLLVSSTIKRILTIIRDNNGELPICHRGQVISYIRRVWDHKTDVICHEAVDTFALLLRIHTRTCEDCRLDALENNVDCEFMTNLAAWLTTLEYPNRSSYKCLKSLFIESPLLMKRLNDDFFERLYGLLSEPHLANSISELIVQNLNDELSWPTHCYHISRLIKIRNFDGDVIKNRLFRLIEKNGKLFGFFELLLFSLKEDDSEMSLDMTLAAVRCLIRDKTQDHDWSQHISSSTMVKALVQPNIEVAVSAWNLIVQHPKTTKPFSETEILLMKAFIIALMNVHEPAAQHTILAGLKTALTRISASASPYFKKLDSQDDSLRLKCNFGEEPSTKSQRLGTNHRGCPLDTQPEEKNDLFYRAKFDKTLVMYSNFARFLWQHCFDSLAERGNVHRHLMALKTMKVLYAPEHYTPQFYNLVNLASTLGSDSMSIVKKCLDDPFMSVQELALNVLNTFDFGETEIDEEHFFENVINVINTVNERSNLASTYKMQFYMHRKPERLKQILERFTLICENNTNLAEQNLLNIVASPIHPVMNVVADLLMSFSEKKNEFSRAMNDEAERDWWGRFAVDRMLPLCFRLSKITSGVVHSVSPEGFIPADAIGEIGLSTTDSQAGFAQCLLVCCWRAHKHVSHALVWIVEKLGPMGMIPAEMMRKIGEFYWLQLTECTHKGAFESAVEGFEKVCKYLWSSANKDEPKPMEWLDEILHAIAGKKDVLNLCSTRRSAGLPHLVVSIVATESKTNGKTSVKRAVNSLLDMTNKDVTHRVHSINVMKQLTTSSALRSEVDFALEKAMAVAINGMRFECEWPERNASAQLLSALITRIFGASRTVQRGNLVDAKIRQSGYEFFSKFSSLYGILFETLENRKEDDKVALFAPLVVLTHLYETSAESPYPLSIFVEPCIEIALRHPHEVLREHAVAAVISIVDFQETERLCKFIGNFKFHPARQNHVLSVVQLIGGLYDQQHIRVFLNGVIVKLINSKTWTNWCDYTVYALFDVCNKMGVPFDFNDWSLSRADVSKKPLAQMILREPDVLKSELSHWLRDSDTCQHCYSLIREHGWQICNKYLHAFIISRAVDDLPNCETRCAVETILDILLKNHKLLENHAKKLCAYIHEQFEQPDSILSSSSTQSYAMLLLFKLEEQVDKRCLYFLTDSAKDENFDIRMNALSLGCEFVANAYKNNFNYTDFEKEMIRAVMRYLQDDELLIRHKATESLSMLLRLDITFNPYVCRVLVADHIGDVRLLNSHSRSDDEESSKFYSCRLMSESVMKPAGEQLFDECTTNEYYEGEEFFGDLLPIGETINMLPQKRYIDDLDWREDFAEPLS